jgi:hypothetical protein
MNPPISTHDPSVWERSPDESVTVSVNGDREREGEADAAPRKRRRKYIAKAWFVDCPLF